MRKVWLQNSPDHTMSPQTGNNCRHFPYCHNYTQNMSSYLPVQREKRVVSCCVPVTPLLTPEKLFWTSPTCFYMHNNSNRKLTLKKKKTLTKHSSDPFKSEGYKTTKWSCALQKYITDHDCQNNYAPTGNHSLATLKQGSMVKALILKITCWHITGRHPIAFFRLITSAM